MHPINARQKYIRDTSDYCRLAPAKQVRATQKRDIVKRRYRYCSEVLEWTKRDRKGKRWRWRTAEENIFLSVLSIFIEGSSTQLSQRRNTFFHRLPTIPGSETPEKDSAISHRTELGLHSIFFRIGFGAAWVDSTESCIGDYSFYSGSSTSHLNPTWSTLYTKWHFAASRSYCWSQN